MDPIGRREFLRRSLMLAAAASSARFIAACTKELPSVTALPAARFRTLEAVSEAVVPPGGAFAEGALDLDVPSRLDRIIAAEDPIIQEQILGALFVLEWSTLPTHGSRFSTLSREERTQVLDEMMHSRLSIMRRISRGLGKGVMFVFYSSEPVWKHIGYEGPLIAQGESR